MFRHFQIMSGRSKVKAESGRSRARYRALAHIPYVPYEDAEGYLAELYRRYGGSEPKVDHIIRVHSLNPPSMEHHMRLYAHLMRGPSPLSRIQREMIAVTVSGVNDCFY